jgi:hydrogenase nickel incorporation protein HypA/HybF
VHELSLSEGMLGLIQDSARRDGFARVRTVWLEIGRLAGVEVEALRFCFDAVTRGSCAEGATLEIERPPGRAWCLGCGDSVTIEDAQAGCPRCGGHQLQVTGGNEMRIKELEVE